MKGSTLFSRKLCRSCVSYLVDRLNVSGLKPVSLTALHSQPYSSPCRDALTARLLKTRSSAAVFEGFAMRALLWEVMLTVLGLGIELLKTHAQPLLDVWAADEAEDT